MRYISEDMQVIQVGCSLRSTPRPRNIDFLYENPIGSVFCFRFLFSWCDPSFLNHTAPHNFCQNPLLGSKISPACINLSKVSSTSSAGIFLCCAISLILSVGMVALCNSSSKIFIISLIQIHPQTRLLQKNFLPPIVPYPIFLFN